MSISIVAAFLFVAARLWVVGFAQRQEATLDVGFALGVAEPAVAVDFHEVGGWRP